MDERIDAHRSRRGEGWRTVEAPLELAAAIARESSPHECVLVDCLTVWVGNLMHHEQCIDTASNALLASLAATPGPVVLVANEVGLGIVPDNAMARQFRDHAGRLHQLVAAQANDVYLMAAGLPLKMKG